MYTTRGVRTSLRDEVVGTYVITSPHNAPYYFTLIPSYLLCIPFINYDLRTTMYNTNKLLYMTWNN